MEVGGWGGGLAFTAGPSAAQTLRFDHKGKMKTVCLLLFYYFSSPSSPSSSPALLSLPVQQKHH